MSAQRYMRGHGRSNNLKFLVTSMSAKRHMRAGAVPPSPKVVSFGTAGASGPETYGAQSGRSEGRREDLKRGM